MTFSPLTGVMEIGVGQTAQPSFVMWWKPLACMEGPASLVAITIPSSSVPARSLTLEISANTLRKVSVNNGREEGEGNTCRLYLHERSNKQLICS